MSECKSPPQFSTSVTGANQSRSEKIRSQPAAPCGPGHTAGQLQPLAVHQPAPQLSDKSLDDRYYESEQNNRSNAAATGPAPPAPDHSASPSQRTQTLPSAPTPPDQSALPIATKRHPTTPAPPFPGWPPTAGSQHYRAGATHSVEAPSPFTNEFARWTPASAHHTLQEALPPKDDSAGHPPNGAPTFPVSPVAPTGLLPRGHEPLDFETNLAYQAAAAAYPNRSRGGDTRSQPPPPPPATPPVAGWHTTPSWTPQISPQGQEGGFYPPRWFPSTGGRDSSPAFHNNYSAAGATSISSFSPTDRAAANSDFAHVDPNSFQSPRSTGRSRSSRPAVFPEPNRARTPPPVHHTEVFTPRSAATLPRSAVTGAASAPTAARSQFPSRGFGYSSRGASPAAGSHRVPPPPPPPPTNEFASRDWRRTHQRHPGNPDFEVDPLAHFIPYLSPSAHSFSTTASSAVVVPPPPPPPPPPPENYNGYSSTTTTRRTDYSTPPPPASRGRERDIATVPTLPHIFTSEEAPRYPFSAPRHNSAQPALHGAAATESSSTPSNPTGRSKLHGFGQQPPPPPPPLLDYRGHQDVNSPPSARQQSAGLPRQDTQPHQRQHPPRGLDSSPQDTGHSMSTQVHPRHPTGPAVVPPLNISRVAAATAAQQQPAPPPQQPVAAPSAASTSAGQTAPHGATSQMVGRVRSRAVDTAATQQQSTAVDGGNRRSGFFKSGNAATTTASSGGYHQGRQAYPQQPHTARDSGQQSQAGYRLNNAYPSDFPSSNSQGTGNYPQTARPAGEERPKTNLLAKLFESLKTSLGVKSRPTNDQEEYESKGPQSARRPKNSFSPEQQQPKYGSPVIPQAPFIVTVPVQSGTDYAQRQVVLGAFAPQPHQPAPPPDPQVQEAYEHGTASSSVPPPPHQYPGGAARTAAHGRVPFGVPTQSQQRPAAGYQYANNKGPAQRNTYAYSQFAAVVRTSSVVELEQQATAAAAAASAQGTGVHVIAAPPATQLQSPSGAQISSTSSISPPPPPPPAGPSPAADKSSSGGAPPPAEPPRSGDGGVEANEAEGAIVDVKAEHQQDEVFAEKKSAAAKELRRLATAREAQRPATTAPAQQPPPMQRTVRFTWTVAKALLKMKTQPAEGFAVQGVPFAHWQLNRIPTLGASPTGCRVQEMFRVEVEGKGAQLSRKLFVKRIPLGTWKKQYEEQCKWNGEYVTDGENFVMEAAALAFLQEYGNGIAPALHAILELCDPKSKTAKSSRQVTHIVIVSELYGEDLVDFLERREQAGRPLEPEEKRRLQHECLVLLARLHSLGFAHLDFTAENILCGPQGLRLCDFAKATPLWTAYHRHIHLRSRHASPTASTFWYPFESCEPTVGKGAYMPPECWKVYYKLEHHNIQSPLDELWSLNNSQERMTFYFRVAEADVYMLGVLLFWIWSDGGMWRCSDPLKDEKYAYLLEQNLNLDLFRECRSWPRELKEFLKRALCPEPKERASLEDLASHSWFEPLTSPQPVVHTPRTSRRIAPPVAVSPRGEERPAATTAPQVAQSPRESRKVRPSSPRAASDLPQ